MRAFFLMAIGGETERVTRNPTPCSTSVTQKQASEAETFDDGDALDVPGRFRVIYHPRPHGGHCCMLLGRRQRLFAGDALISHEIVAGGRGRQVMPSFFNVDTEAAL